jgi:hypothetical protein
MVRSLFSVAFDSPEIILIIGDKFKKIQSPDSRPSIHAAIERKRQAKRSLPDLVNQKY